MIKKLKTGIIYYPGFGGLTGLPKNALSGNRHRIGFTI
jgi:hypothetical protein